MRGRMFSVNGKRVLTWNPYTGCMHRCSYCYAEKLITTRLKKTKKYKNCGFKPTFHLDDMNEKFGKNKTVFVCSLADLWGEWVPTDVIHTVVNHCATADWSNTFYFLTKNPSRYVAFFKSHPHMYRNNFVLGVTIETDEPAGELEAISKAPDSAERFLRMTDLPQDYRKFISIEPIMKFGMGDDKYDGKNSPLAEMVKSIKPEFVYVGYENHNNHLPEPTLKQTKQLIKGLKQYTEVRVKTLREANK